MRFFERIFSLRALLLDVQALPDDVVQDQHHQHGDRNGKKDQVLLDAADILAGTSWTYIPVPNTQSQGSNALT